MACDAATLFTNACSNDLAEAAGNEVQFRALMLQLLYVKSGSTKTLAELMTDACTNGFTQAAGNEQQFRALELQLLCVLTGG